MKVQRPHLPPLNTAAHCLEDGLVTPSGSLLDERKDTHPSREEGR
jgi:hypothetical protein